MQHQETLFSIDEKTHSIVERITQHFMHTEHIDENLKARISDVTFLYHHQLFLTYYELSKNYIHYNKGLQHIVLSRALKNATQIVKWQHYTHHNEPADLWSKVSSIFKIAEQLSLLKAKIQSYSDQEPISLSSAYIQICMLGTLQNSNFRLELLKQM